MNATPVEAPVEQAAECRDEWLTRMLDCLERELANDDWLRDSPLLNQELREFEEYLRDCRRPAPEPANA
jgi:hypothetical protein